MKTKVINGYMPDVENELNEFVKTVEVIDIKISTTNFSGFVKVTFLVLYNEKTT